MIRTLLKPSNQVLTPPAFFHLFRLMARKIPVQAAIPNVTCLISSARDISLPEANHVADVFLRQLKDTYGDDVLPSESPHAFCFDISVDANGQITSPLPTPDQIEKAKGHWATNFKTFFRLHP
jgi:hypothetical protein